MKINFKKFGVASLCLRGKSWSFHKDSNTVESLNILIKVFTHHRIDTYVAVLALKHWEVDLFIVSKSSKSFFHDEIMPNKVSNKFFWITRFRETNNSFMYAFCLILILSQYKRNVLKECYVSISSWIELNYDVFNLFNL